MYGGAARRSVAECDGGAEHVVYDVDRMPHVWPGPATRLVWEFFEAHRLGG
jgi:polyhydroxybutyrate depolymerase